MADVDEQDYYSGFHEVRTHQFTVFNCNKNATLAPINSTPKTLTRN